MIWLKIIFAIVVICILQAILKGWYGV